MENNQQAAQEKPVAQTAPEAVQTSVATESNALTLQDLSLAAQVIDVASQRGAFKANELENVGRIYNRITTFLSGVKSAADANAAAPAADKTQAASA